MALLCGSLKANHHGEERSWGAMAAEIRVGVLRESGF